MFSPLLPQDHLRVLLVSAVLCPRAKGSRSFFLVTTANSYSVMTRNKQFLKQMSRVGRPSGFWSRWQAENYSCGHHEKFPPDRGKCYIHTWCLSTVPENDSHWALMCFQVCSRALTSTLVPGVSVSAVLGSNPALTTTWICFSVAPS